MIRTLPEMLIISNLLDLYITCFFFYFINLLPDNYFTWQVMEPMKYYPLTLVGIYRNTGSVNSNRIYFEHNFYSSSGSGNLFGLNAHFGTTLPSPSTLSSLSLIDIVCAAKAHPGRDTNSLLALCQCWPGYWLLISLPLVKIFSFLFGFSLIVFRPFNCMPYCNFCLGSVMALVGFNASAG